MLVRHIFRRYEWGSEGLSWVGGRLEAIVMSDDLGTVLPVVHNF